jgi:site-specific recombinase XerD
MKIVIRFRLRTKKGASKSVPLYIYCRLRVNGVRAGSDIATGVSCTHADWDNKRQVIRGYSERVREQNVKLEQFRNDLDSIYNDLRRQDKAVTAEIIKQLYVNKQNPTAHTLLNFMKKYIKDHKKGRIRESSMSIWEGRYRKIKKYIETELKRNDVDLLEVTPKWLQRLDHYLVSKMGHCHNYSSYIIQSIRAVLDYAVIEEALQYNATLSLKLQFDKKKPIKYLTVAQIEALQSFQFPDELQPIVDCFLVQCFTGMAYNELMAFDKEKHLKTDELGISWIMIVRGKSNELCKIPLLHQARNILTKYNFVLPTIRNDKMNKLIKEAAKAAGIGSYEEITTHVGRKTCGCYLLNNGVRIEVVSKILGHKSVKTTETFYTELLTSSISHDLRKNGLI